MPATKRVLLMGPRSEEFPSRVLVQEDDRTGYPIYRPHTAAQQDRFPVGVVQRPNVADSASAFVNFEVWDLPGGQFEPEVFDILPEDVGAAIYVIDGKAFSTDSPELAHKIAASIMRLYDLNDTIQFYVFVHKMETGTADGKAELLEDLRLRLADGMEEELPETSTSAQDMPMVHFQLTSVYDHSVYEAFSRTVQRLLPCQGALERLMDLICQNCSFEKAFLFHLPSKLYIATDSSPVDSKTHEICSDFVDLCVDFGVLYTPETDADTETTTSDDGLPSSAEAPNPEEARHPATSKVTMATGLTIAHWEMDERLSLIALLSPQALETHAALIEYNVNRFRESVLKMQALELNLSA